MRFQRFLLAALMLLPAPALAQEAPAQEPPSNGFKPDPAWKPLGPSLWFDREGKRLVLRAHVTLRDGYLEHLLCRKNSKEHESVLATDATPRMIHAGLILAGAKEGHPVRFEPEFEPPTGDPIQITLEWTSADGTKQTADARRWVKQQDSDKTLQENWVFAGSQLIKLPDRKEVVYAADSGDLFTVSNFTNAILDLPFASSADNASRSFVANKDEIPPEGTPVTMFLQPAKQEKGASTRDPGQ